jgi:two-component system nitrate/nitrite response regulator NarL
LSPRELQTLRLLAQGASTSTIGARLDIHSTTVRTHVQHVLEKLGVHSRLEAVACASRNGLLRSAGD